MDDFPPVSLQFLRRFLPGVTIDAVQPVQRSGFSDARVFRVHAVNGDYALREWPAQSIDENRLRELHRYLAFLKQAGLPVAVPVTVGVGGGTWIEERERCWQLETWLPGAPQESEPIPDARLNNAMQLLARLHEVSAQYVTKDSGHEWFSVGYGTCPAVKKRRQIISGWSQDRMTECLRRLSESTGTLPRLLERVLAAFVILAPEIDAALAALEHVAFALHPCWRDLWKDHVLFTGDEITGLVDPAAARTDHPAADLSRLLGSLVGDDQKRWSEALEDYERFHPLQPQEHRLIVALDRSGVLLSGMYWVDRWRQDGDGRLSANPMLVDRLTKICERLDRQRSQGV